MTELVRYTSINGWEEAWQSLLPRCAFDAPFMTPRWQQAWWEEYGDSSETHLLLMKGDEGLNAIAPLSRRNGEMTFIGDPNVCDYADFLVSQDAEDQFYPMLLDYLDEEEWQELKLFSLPQESPTLTKLPDLARERGHRVDIEEEDVAPGVALPDTWDEYLANLTKKDRHELRRKMRRLESYDQGFDWYGITDWQEVGASLDDFFLLMRKSREEKSIFLTGPRESFFRSMVMKLSHSGLLKLFFLEMGGRKVAAALCFDYDSKRFLYNSGLDPDYKYYSVGLLLHALCIGDAIEGGRSYFDFLRGPEPYKYDLGGKNRVIYRMVVTRS